MFADPSKKSALSEAPAEDHGLSMLVSREPVVRGFNPDLLSGLAFAGANRSPEAERDDGILTAEEIVTLSLSGVDLVMLSACETGLGETAGVEGLLGVQRAFQVSGVGTRRGEAKTVYLSILRSPFVRRTIISFGRRRIEDDAIAQASYPAYQVQLRTTRQLEMLGELFGTGGNRGNGENVLSFVRLLGWLMPCWLRAAEWRVVIESA